MKAVICFALLQEARPFIERADCKLVVQKKQLHYFSGNATDILVSGVGDLNMASAMGWLFGQNPEEKVVWNVGTCGGSQSAQHQWYRIIKVNGEADGRAFFPEVIRKSIFPFRELITLHAPADKMKLEQVAPALCDMEGYAFCRAAQSFVVSSRIHLLKWVSDDDGGMFYKSGEWKTRYAEQVDAVLNEILSETAYLHEKEHQVNPDISIYLESINRKVALTFTQREQLKNALFYARYYKQHADLLEVIEQLPATLANRHQQKIAVTQLLKSLRDV